MASFVAGSAIPSGITAASCGAQNIISRYNENCFACRRTQFFWFLERAQTRKSLLIKKQNKQLRNLTVCATFAERRTRERYRYNLYELLGIDNNASQNDIRQAYRWLQKRCHPDVAGEEGHDMAILLNEAYATLSDSQMRAAYDETVAETKDFEEYTGHPLYSSWLGPVGEDRAVFVDEIKCVGCLKCALIAPNTFCVENKFGRARVVAQWGDSEATIKDAITACPVDCIWWVDRTKLPALEFVMSKQPRTLAGADGETNGGVRVTDIFSAAEKLLKKFTEYQDEEESLQETSAQQEARIMAAQAIQARAGRWWHLIMGNRKLWENSWHSTEWNRMDSRAAQCAIIPFGWGMSPEETFHGTSGRKAFSIPPKELAALYEAATERRRGKSMEISDRVDEEYWAPTERISCPVSFPVPNPIETYLVHEANKDSYEIDSGTGSFSQDNGLLVWLNNAISTAPLVVGMAAAILVGSTSRPDAAYSKVDIAGPMPTELSSSPALQVLLAAAVWYAVAAATSRIIWVLMTQLIGSMKKNS